MKKAKRVMTKETKRRTINSLIGLTAAAIVGGVGALALAFAGGLPNSAKIDLDNVSVGEIWNETDQIFDKTNLQTLLNYIAGQENTTIKTIKSLAATPQTARNMRATEVGNKKANKDIIVGFGGLTWTPTYLSLDNDGDPILTLWLSSNEQSAFTGKSTREGLYHGFVYSDTTKKTGLYSDWSADWLSNDTSCSYPSSMYGTSYIRAVTLNNGGSYSLEGGETLKSVSKDSKSVFAKFTMSTDTNKLPTYIVAPSKVKWQEFQSAKLQLSERIYPNDGYQANQSDTEYSSGLNFSKKANYNTWMNDKLWLPSITETGYSDTKRGIWDTSSVQRENYDGTTDTLKTSSVLGTENKKLTDSVGTCSWLRSGYSPESVCQIDPNGNKFIPTPVVTSLAVRPALHLNLTAAWNSVYSYWLELAASRFDNEDPTKAHLADSKIGTKDNPYEIATAEQLALLAYDVNQGIDLNTGRDFSGKYFKQTANISLGGYQWTPIGVATNRSYIHSFAGTYNGNGYSIDGLTILTNAYVPMDSETPLWGLGLFGVVSGTIQNVTIESGEFNPTIQNTPDISGSGAIVGIAYGGAVIKNCMSWLDLDNGQSSGVGGIVGSTQDGAVTISNCINYGDITVSGMCGGILGLDGNGSTILNCKNYGNIKSDNYCAGGIVGEAYNSATIENCISDAIIMVTDASAGSLAGHFQGKMKNCAAYGYLIYDIDSSVTDYRNGVFVGSSGDEYTTAECLIEGCSFIGSANIKEKLEPYSGWDGGKSTNVTVKCSYVWVNQVGCYSSQSDNWADYYRVVDGKILQKTLFIEAQNAEPQTTSSIIRRLSNLGFNLYVQ